MMLSIHQIVCIKNQAYWDGQQEIQSLILLFDVKQKKEPIGFGEFHWDVSINKICQMPRLMCMRVFFWQARNNYRKALAKSIFDIKCLHTMWNKQTMYYLDPIYLTSFGEMSDRDMNTTTKSLNTQTKMSLRDEHNAPKCTLLDENKWVFCIPTKRKSNHPQ